jgi:hypothetical protein
VRALKALKILAKSGIDPRSIANGALLNTKSHEVTHTRQYYRFINNMISTAYGKGGAWAARVRVRLAEYKKSSEKWYRRASAVAAVAAVVPHLGLESVQLVELLYLVHTQGPGQPPLM